MGSVKEKYVSEERLRERKANLEETLIFHERHFNAVCNNFRKKVAACSNEELAKNLLPQLSEIASRYAETKSLREQADVLAYILEKDLATADN